MTIAFHLGATSEPDGEPEERAAILEALVAAGYGKDLAEVIDGRVVSVQRKSGVTKVTWSTPTDATAKLGVLKQRENEFTKERMQAWGGDGGGSGPADYFESLMLRADLYLPAGRLPSKVIALPGSPLDGLRVGPIEPEFVRLIDTVSSLRSEPGYADAARIGHALVRTLGVAQRFGFAVRVR